jgi:glutaredoxin
MNSQEKRLVMYLRNTSCLYVSTARHVLDQMGISYQEIDIDRDKTARERVLNWTGFLSVPTLVIARPGETVPFEDPRPLPRGQSPRGVDRGSMLTEPSGPQLEQWLARHGLAAEDAIDAEMPLDRKAK